MRVLVTGPGRVGANLLTRLGQRGITGRVLRRSDAGSLPSGWDFIPADVTEPATLAGACSGCDTVLHMAALTHSNSRRRYESVNVGGTRNVLEIARAAGARHFVHVSTRAVAEDGGTYSATKRSAEDLVRSGGVPWTILRPAEVYGTAGREGLADLIQRTRRGRWVPIVGDGSSRLAPVLVDDVLEGFCAAVAGPSSGRVLHLAGPEELTLVELTDRLASYFRSNPRRLSLPPWALRTAAQAFRVLRMKHPPLVVDQIARLLSRKPYEIESAAEALGFRPRPLEEGLDLLSRRGDLGNHR